MTTAIVLRREIKNFDAGPCFYCERPTFKPWDCESFWKKANPPWLNTRDHVIPISSIPKEKRGRLTILTVPSCMRCNNKKGKKQPSRRVVQRAINFMRMKHKSMRRQKWYIG